MSHFGFVRHVFIGWGGLKRIKVVDLVNHFFQECNVPETDTYS